MFSSCHSRLPTRVAYAISKAGGNALMRHVASRYGAKGVRANCIVPGSVLSKRLETLVSPQMKDWMLSLALIKSRLGRPEDIAAMGALLMSDEGGVYHLTGHRRRWRCYEGDVKCLIRI